jgi:hypothetical protein
MAAYKYGYFDPESVVELTARVCRERGVDIDVECFINDRRQSGPPLDAPKPSTIPAALLAQTTFRWTVSQDAPAFEQLCIHIDDAPDAIKLTVQIDGQRVSRSDAEAALRAMETIAVTNALEAAPVP